jgi:hypothetical protein
VVISSSGSAVCNNALNIIDERFPRICGFPHFFSVGVPDSFKKNLKKCFIDKSALPSMRFALDLQHFKFSLLSSIASLNDNSFEGICSCSERSW